MKKNNYLAIYQKLFQLATSKGDGQIRPLGLNPRLDEEPLHHPLRLISHLFYSREMPLPILARMLS